MQLRAQFARSVFSFMYCIIFNVEESFNIDKSPINEIEEKIFFYYRLMDQFFLDLGPHQI